MNYVECIGSYYSRRKVLKILSVAAHCYTTIVRERHQCLATNLGSHKQDLPIDVKIWLQVVPGVKA